MGVATGGLSTGAIINKINIFMTVQGKEKMVVKRSTALTYRKVTEG